jgi:D-beta-D-heptose 7-phosphate kinase/D-beta-D-heptose 1-phosphate adenosyltransferase
MKKNWKKILAGFKRRRILVVGDLMLDQYVYGKVSRISPEAPVPVVEVQSESFFPGGAANVARNLRALGGRVELLGIVGDDAMGRELRRMMNQSGVDTHGFQVDGKRPTILKTRIIAIHQQVVRIDREDKRRAANGFHERALRFLKKEAGSLDAVVFEDYGKGFVQQDFLDEMLAIARGAKLLTFADPNAHHRLEFHGLTGITPNRKEAFWLAGIADMGPTQEVRKDRALMEVGKILLRETGVENVLITLGEHGMCLFRENEKPHHIPTAAREVFDVSGAGDTVISAFSLALSSGLDAVSAAYVANQAAGLVVAKAGTATVSPGELLSVLK